VADPPAGHRRDPQHLLGRVRQPLDAAPEQVVQGGRQPLRSAGGEQLFGEERVAVRAGQDLVEEPRRRRGSENAGQQGAELGAVEAAQLDPLDLGAAVQLGQERAQRVAATQLVAAIGAHQDDCGVGQVGHQKRQQV
jgi:hypothetical protein